MGSIKSWLTGGWGELSLDKFIGTAGCESGLVSKTWGAREISTKYHNIIVYLNKVLSVSKNAKLHSLSNVRNKHYN